VFLAAPVVKLRLALAAWGAVDSRMDLGWVISDINVGGTLTSFAISVRCRSTASSWPGGRRTREYSFLAALRSAAQDGVLLESSIGFVIITVLICEGSLKPVGRWSKEQHKHGLAS